MSMNNVNDSNEVFDEADINQNKTMAGLAYILFFLPLLACPGSRYGRYHANQALLLTLTSFIGMFVFRLIPFIGWFVLLPIFSLIMFVLFIIGLLNGLNGRAKELPIIGRFRILK